MADIGILYLLVRYVGMAVFPWYAVAATISFLIATFVNFSISWNWVFADRRGHGPTQFMKFFMVTLGGLILNNLIIIGLVESFGFAVLIAKLCSTAVVVFYNFGANNWWAFRQNTVSSD